MLPVLRFGYIPVFDRIVMNVVKMIFAVSVIANDVIPKSLLPELHGLRWQKPNFPFVSLCEIRFERMHNVAEIAFPAGLDQNVEVVG